MSSPDKPIQFRYETTLGIPGADFHLRLGRMDDSPELLTIFDQHRTEMEETLAVVKEVNSLDAARHHMQVMLGRYQEGESMQYRMVEGEPGNDAPLFGNVSLFGHNKDEHTALSGVWIAPGHRGRDRAYLAVSRVLAYGQEVWGLERVNLRIVVTNGRSERLATKLGFTITGIPFHDPIERDKAGNPRIVSQWTKDL